MAGTKTSLTTTAWAAIDDATDVALLANIHCPLPETGERYFSAVDLLVAAAEPDSADEPSVQLRAGETMLTSAITEVWPDGGALYGRLSVGSIPTDVLVEAIPV